MRRVLASAALAACLLAPAAHAAVTYTFAGSMTLNLVNPDDPDGPELEVPVNVGFTLTRPTYITNGVFTPDTCADDNAILVCGDMEFDNFPNLFGVDVVGDYLSFRSSYSDGGFNNFSGGAFYFFAPGAFAANGSYSNAGWPISCCFGNAGPATLVVSGIPDATGAIPEPGAWALMIIGFGGAGAALRRRRNRDTYVAA